MSRTLTISDRLFAKLEAAARARGLSQVEQLLELWDVTEAKLQHRHQVVSEIDTIRERLYVQFGEMSDSVDLIRDDRSR